MTKGNKQAIVILVLGILLLIAIGYIAFSFYVNWKVQQDTGIFQVGAQYGYEQAVAQIFNTASACQQVPLYYENNTINVIAVECLQG